MPAGKSARCRACTSARRSEIDRRLIAGESTRKVSTWLASNGEKISNVGINKHKANHLDIRADAQAQLTAEVIAAFAAGVQKVVADASLLDELAGFAMDTVRRLAPRMAAPSMAQAATYAAALREGRELVKLRDDLLGGPRRGMADGERPLVTIRYADGIAPLPDGSHPQPTAEPGASTPAAGE